MDKLITKCNKEIKKKTLSKLKNKKKATYIERTKQKLSFKHSIDWFSTDMKKVLGKIFERKIGISGLFLHGWKNKMIQKK